MSSNTEIGGFLVKLGIHTDKNSFEKAQKHVNGLSDGFSKLIGIARNAAVVLASTAVATGTVDQQATHTASKLGIATTKLNEWKAAANLAGVSSSALVTSMTKINDVLAHQKIDASGVSQLSEKLGVYLKMNFKDIKDLDASEAYKKILNTARENVIKGKTSEYEALTGIGDVLGSAGQDIFSEMMTYKKTAEEFLAEGSSTQHRSEQDIQKGAEFKHDVEWLQEDLKGYGAELGDEIAKVLDKPLKDINSWLSEHGETIETTIKSVAELIGNVVDLLSPLVALVGKIAGRNIVQVVNGMNKILEGDVAGGTKSLLFGDEFDNKVDDYKNATGAGTVSSNIIVGGRSIPIYGDAVHFVDFLMHKLGFTSDEAYAIVNNAYLNSRNNTTKDKSKNKNKKADVSMDDGIIPPHITNKVNDGIMRPNGQVTQVAPDDWVFAARNVSDLASMFLPQGFGISNMNQQNSYVINQTFNVSGTNLMPQTIKQQAYSGTMDGLAQIMNQSSNRLQMMSGTR